MQGSKHFAFVAILGATNVGKSTLVNRLVGQKVSIVSPKVQTTRSRIRGLINEGDTQLVLVDTPGIFRPTRRLDRAMVASAWTEADESDLRLLVVDGSRGLDSDTITIMDTLKKNHQKAILVLNKTDLTTPDKLFPLTATLNQSGLFTDTFPISAQTGDNVDSLKQYLINRAPLGAWLFPDDNVSDLPDRLFAAEVTREKLFLHLQQELPYMTTVETTQFQEQQNGIRIEQTIYVARPGQRSIVLGRSGQMIKKIGAAARYEMSKMFDRPVHLFLFVKVRENWQDDPAHYTDWGLDFNA